MKKLLKNKLLVLVISVSILCAVYFVAQKAIDSYIFNSNGDIVSEEVSVEDGKEKSSGGNGDGDSRGTGGQFAEEEMNLVLEEAEVDSDGESAEDEKENVGSDSGDDAMSDGNDEKYEGDGGAPESEKIYVYITGEVNVPGVVILNEGSRIVDAINVAGGTTANANVSKVNLVYVLEDGMKVNIPNNNDLKNNPDFEYITMNSGDGASDDYFGSNSSAGSGSSGTGASMSSSSSSGSGSGGTKNYSIVNINTATQTELETLPGIGPSLALKIINYRKENGKFSSVDEIKNVSGIGESKFENLKSYISI